MDTKLVVTFVGIIVAGLAGILGVWLERDRTAPRRWAYVFTTLILLATGLKLAHSIAQKTEGARSAEAQARVLERLVVLSERGTNPALEQFVVAELDAQSRSSPEVIERLEGRIEAKGGDPTALRRKVVAARRASAGLPPRTSSKAKTKKPEDAAETMIEDAVEEAAEELGLPLDLDLGDKDAKTGKTGKGEKTGKAGKTE